MAATRASSPVPGGETRPAGRAHSRGSPHALQTLAPRLPGQAQTPITASCHPAGKADLGPQPQPATCDTSHRRQRNSSGFGWKHPPALQKPCSATPGSLAKSHRSPPRPNAFPKPTGCVQHRVGAVGPGRGRPAHAGAGIAFTGAGGSVAGRRLQGDTCPAPLQEEFSSLQACTCPRHFFFPEEASKSYHRQLGEVLLKARPMAGAA